MKKFLLLLMVLMSVASKAQIGGLSASKLVVMSATPITQNYMEFEPSFNIGRNLRFMDSYLHQQNVEDNDYNDFAFRFTLGTGKNSETGIILPVGVAQISYGFKYRFLNNKKFQSALVVGSNFDFGYDKYIKHVGVGWIGTYNWTDNLSTDADLQILRDFKNNSYHFFYNLETGYYYEKIQFIAGINTSLSIKDNKYESMSIFFNPGITYEQGESFIIVIGFPYSVLAMNDYQSFNFMFALTITLK